MNPHAATCGALWLAVVASGPVLAQPAPTPERLAALDTARNQVRDLRQRQFDAVNQLEGCERQLAGADDELARDSGLDLAKTRERGLRAIGIEAECGRLRTALASVRDRLQQASAELRKRAAETSLAEAGAPAADTRGLVKHVRDAQKDLGELKRAAATTLGDSDAAVVQALEADRTADPADARPDLPPISGTAAQSLANALRVRPAISAAQRAANDLAESVLRLHACDEKPAAPDCARDSREQRVAAAEAYKSRFDQRLDTAKRLNDDARLQALQVSAAAESLDPVEQARLVRFLTVVNANPDAKSLLGGDAAKFSAGRSEKAASIKLVLRSTGLSWLRDTAFTLSTPEVGEGDRVYSTDALANATQLEVSRHLTRGWFRGGSRDSEFIQQSGVSAAYGYERPKYTDPVTNKDANGGVIHPYSLSGYVSWMRVPKDGSADGAWLQLLRLKAQRQADLKDSRSKPGYPVMRNSYEYSYELRATFQTFAVWPRFSYNDLERSKEVNLPVYLIRSADTEGSRPFTAGFNLKWTSEKGGSFGIFVGAPLDFAISGK